MRILACDDDHLMRTIVADWLTNLGHEVVTAEDGLRAWVRYNEEHYPVIISDVMMPNMNGYELCKKVRAANHEKYTYIIVLTALEGKDSYLKALHAGADDFINKPFDEAILEARLEVAQRILKLQTTVKQLEGLLPVCSYCKRIRKDDEEHNHTEWVAIDSYIQEKANVDFSHGVCPDCYNAIIRPQLGDEDD